MHNNDLQNLLQNLVPVPAPGSGTGHWAAYLYQTFPGRWIDVAHALERSPATVFLGAQAYARSLGVDWPLRRRGGR